MQIQQERVQIAKFPPRNCNLQDLHLHGNATFRSRPTKTEFTHFRFKMTSNKMLHKTRNHFLSQSSQLSEWLKSSADQH